ncbi:hypothetical protein BDN72DRAFT_241216 [Pluteus cervinus]|uniref:Uncharacterized protein n=1 Tax=Pluteus cervinus TaxID=181527 RepID=A0ACD3BF60_9AGAR|nr:hypothetical protein BDN72DRAFT_241216 [Pluteus cervinus]
MLCLRVISTEMTNGRSKRQSRSGKIPTQISGDGRLGDKIQQEQYGRVESSAPLSSRLDGFYGGAAASLDLRPQVPHSVLPVSIRAGQGPPDPPTHEAFPKSALPPTGWAPSQAPSTATYGRTSVYQSAQPAKYQGSHRVVPVSLPEVRNDALPNPVVVHPTGVAVTDTAGQSSSRYTKYEPSIMTPQQHLHHTLPEATMNTGRGIPKPVTSERGHRKKSRKVHSTDDRRLIPDVRPPYPTEKNGAHSRGQSLDDHRAIPSIMSPPLQLLSVSQNTEASQHKRPTDQILTAIPLKEPTRSGQEPSSANFVNSFEVPLATGVSRPTISEEPKVSAMNGGSISADARHIGNTLLRPPSSAGLRPETEKSRRHHKESKEEPKRISPKRVPSQLITQPPIGDPNQGHIMGPSANLTTEPKPASASQMPYVLLPEQPPLFLVNGSVSHTGQYPSEHTPQQIIAQASDRSTAADPIPTYVQQPEWRPQPHTREPSTDAPPLDRQRQDSTKGAQNGTPITSHPGPPPPTPPYQVWTPARDNHNPKLQPDTQSTQPPKTPFRPEIRHKGLAEILSSPHPKDPGSTKPSPTTHHELTPTTTNTTPPGRLPQHDIAEHNPHGHAHYVSTSSNPVNVGPATLPEVQIASRVPPSPVVTSHPTHSHHSRKVSEGSIHPDARTPVEGRGKYSPAHNTPRSPNMDADQKTPASPGHNSSWSRRRGAQALQEQANHAPTSSSSRLPTSVIDPTHPYQAEVALQVHEKDHGVALASPMPRFVRIHPDQYPLANPSAEPTSQPATQPSKVEHSSQHKSKRHTRDSSSKNHSPPGAIPGTVSTQKPLATNGISPSAAAQQALPPKFATSPRAIPLSRIASDESGLRTPSSLAMSNLQPTVSRASLPEGRSWSKGGLLNKLLSRGTKPEPNPTPEIWVPPQAKQVAPVPQPNGSRPSLDSVRAQTTSRRPLPATVGKNQGSIFTPFKYLKSKRNNSMSAVSIQAQHGTPTNTVIGSPTASMHSTAAPPIIPPPLRDPIVAADRWTRTAEIRKKPDGKTRRPRPGVTFDIAEEDSPEAGRRPKPTRSKKRSSTSTTTTPQDNPKHHA